MENDVRYIVNKEKKTIVCCLQNCHEIAINRIIKYARDYFPGVEYYISDNYIGIAKCAPEDTWDEEFGKKLALKRAKRKRSNAINNALYRYFDKTQMRLQNLMTYGIHSDIDKE